MAAIFDKVSNRLSLRLNTGTDPGTGRAILRSVGFAISPNATANNIDAVSAKLSPLFVHPVIAVEASGIALLGDDGN